VSECIYLHPADAHSASLSAGHDMFPFLRYLPSALNEVKRKALTFREILNKDQASLIDEVRQKIRKGSAATRSVTIFALRYNVPLTWCRCTVMPSRCSRTGRSSLI
jgi:hypothetical protein